MFKSWTSISGILISRARDFPLSFFLSFLAHFSSIPRTLSGLVTRWIWVSTLSSGFVKGHQGDVGTNTFRSTTIVLFIIQWVEKARPPLRVFRSQINLPASVMRALLWRLGPFPRARSIWRAIEPTKEIICIWKISLIN